MKCPSSLLLLTALVPTAWSIEAAPTTEQLAFFEKKIRPVLSEHCYKCHSEKSEKIRGGLVLDTREGIRRGGDNGAAVTPGNLDESLLIEAVRWHNKDFAMPPEKSGGKLPDAVIADFEAWVKMGAPDPREGKAKVVAKYDDAEARKWWSFQPPQKPAVPQPKNAVWARTDLDRFVLAGLEARGLAPVADATRTTLVRRLYFDLIGLPPTPKEVDDFLKDTSPEATAKLVDRLLASPQFGERWGRHWLDVARYAESTGKDVNMAYPHAWRYRDYVVASLNADKPYDEFLREQIAGDLLPADGEKERAAQLVATGFLAIGTKGLNEQKPHQFYLDLADEQIDTVTQATLGMTIACARCHDHKFDPVSQREYYALAGIFLSTDTRYGTAQNVQNRHASDLIDLPAVGLPVVNPTISPEEMLRLNTRLAELKKEQETFLRARLQERMGNAGGAGLNGQDQLRQLRLVAEIGEIEAQLKTVTPQGQPKPVAMGAKDLPASRSEGLFGRRGGPDGLGGPGGPGGGEFLRRAAQRRFGGGRPPQLSTIMDSPLFIRGEADRPSDKVPRGFPSALTHGNAPEIPAGTSGRLQLAEWIADEKNPLTARVFVNRAWHWLFGQGLVDSVDNFGTTGAKPSNQALLDHLAVKFMADGWSVKKLIREIVLSHAYQLSGAHDERAYAADPENRLIWRANKRRLDAECVRDAMLSVSSQLELTPPPGSLIARAGDGPIGGPRLRGVQENAIINADDPHRSIYLPVPRDVLPDALAVFDAADNAAVTGKRETTNVPSQALYLLNSDFVTKQSTLAAEKILAAYPGGSNGTAHSHFDQRFGYATWLVLNRAPTGSESQAAKDFLTRFPSDWQRGDKSGAALKDAADIKAAWTSLCRALFSSADFRYVN